MFAKRNIVSVSSLRRGVALKLLKPLHMVMKYKLPQKLSVDVFKISNFRQATVIIGAIVRNEDVIIANASHSIEQGDHVIMFITDKKICSRK